MGIIRHPKDFLAGLLFTATGIAAILIAAKYPLGTAARMVRRKRIFCLH